MKLKHVLWILGGLLALSIAWYLGSPLFLSKTVHEEFPSKASRTLDVERMSPEEKEKAKAAMMETLKDRPKTSVTEMPPTFADPRLIKQGKFRDVDSIHRGKGDARIYRFQNMHLLRLENIEIANGPDLYVYLVKHPDPTSAKEVKEGFINLGKLKGNLGSQNYSIPAGTDLSQYQSVIIFCQLFSVLFSPAPLVTH